MQQNNGYIFCRVCGKQLLSGTRFCSGCGTPVMSPQSAPPAPSHVPQPQNAPVGGMNFSSAPAQVHESTPTPTVLLFADDNNAAPMSAPPVQPQAPQYMPTTPIQAEVIDQTVSSNERNIHRECLFPNDKPQNTSEAPAYHNTVSLQQHPYSPFDDRLDRTVAADDRDLGTMLLFPEDEILDSTVPSAQRSMNKPVFPNISQQTPPVDTPAPSGNPYSGTFPTNAPITPPSQNDYDSGINAAAYPIPGTSEPNGNGNFISNHKVLFFCLLGGGILTVAAIVLLLIFLL